MNEIKIKTSYPVNSQSVYKKHKVYRVHLGIDNVVVFNNKQDADNYAGMVNKHINDFIRISNILYGEVFNIYRTVWPGMDSVTNKRLTQLCELLNHHYSIIFERESNMAFNTCFDIFKTLQQITKCLEDYLKLKKNYLELYKINTIEATLNSNSFGIQIIKSRMKNDK